MISFSKQNNNRTNGRSPNERFDEIGVKVTVQTSEKDRVFRHC